MTSYAHDTPRLAEIYDRVSDSQYESGRRLIERLELGPGDRVLDVGCGTGRLARFIAEKVSSTGRVVGIDPLPDRIALAKKGGGGVEFAVGRAEELGGFADGSFDAVCLSAVFHWIPDKAKALAEIARVLRPGGRVAATTLPHELRHTGTVARAAGAVLRRPKYAQRIDAELVARLHRNLTLTELLGLLLDSGLSLRELHVVPRAHTRATGEEVVDFVQASSFGNFLGFVPEELREDFREELAAVLDGQRGEAGIVVRDYGVVFVAERAPAVDRERP